MLSVFAVTASPTQDDAIAWNEVFLAPGPFTETDTAKPKHTKVKVSVKKKGSSWAVQKTGLIFALP